MYGVMSQVQVLPQSFIQKFHLPQYDDSTTAER